jgi:hypothetical protein
MSSLEELSREIGALKKKIVANEALLDAGTLSEKERVAIRNENTAIRQQISTDTVRLTALEQERREVRLQQQQQAGECLFVPDEFIASVFLREMCSLRTSLTCLFLCIVSPVLSLFPTPVASQM